MDVRQIATADDSRSLSEWVASRLDVALDTAKPLVRTMRRLQDRPDLQEALATGESPSTESRQFPGFSRMWGLLEWADVSSVRREAAQRARITAELET